MAGGNLELPGNIGLDVAYVGSKVSSLPITRNQNVVPRTEQEKGIRATRRVAGMSATFADPSQGCSRARR
jgi:hypothetical protein